MVQLDPSQLNLSLLSLGAYIILFGLFSFVLKEKVNLGESPIAILIGISLGPHGVFNLLQWAASGDPTQADSLMLALSRIVLGVQLTLIGIQLPFRFLRTEVVSLLILIGPVMTMMWLATSACVLAAFPSMPVLIAGIVAACTTATDPVLSNTIVKGQFADAYVSLRLRNLISAESGLNDGMGYPFLFLSIFLLREATVGEALKRWTLDTLGWAIIGSTVYGAIVGYACLLLLRFATRSGFIDKESFLLYGVGMGIFIVGSAGALGTDDLLACFIAGNVFTWDDRYRVDTADDEVSNVLDLLLNQTFFIFVGLMVPFDLFRQPEYGITPGRLVLLSFLVLIFRRLPALLLHYRLIPSVRDPSEAAFAGYLGPIGAGACFYASLVLDEFKADDTNPLHQLVRIYVKPITYALVLASIAGHSFMIPVLKAFLVYYDVGRIKLGDSESDYEDSDSGTETPTPRADAPAMTDDNAPHHQRSSIHHQMVSDANAVMPGFASSRPVSTYSAAGASSTRGSISNGHQVPATSSSTHPLRPRLIGTTSTLTLLPPRHFETSGEHTPSSWRMSGYHRLSSVLTQDENTGEIIYSLGDRDTPSAWVRVAGRRGGRESRSVSRSRANASGSSANRLGGRRSQDLESGDGGGAGVFDQGADGSLIQPPPAQQDDDNAGRVALIPQSDAVDGSDGVIGDDTARSAQATMADAPRNGSADRYTADD
ncbi:hypothetical protein V8E36_003905 [Tilletia maclaganii]